MEGSRRAEIFETMSPVITTTGIVLITTAVLLAGCDACGSRGLSCTAPADNCTDVFCDTNRESGHYWVKKAGSSTAERVYCVRDHLDCGEGNWMRVAQIDTTERFFTCPGGSESMVVNKRQYCRTPTAGGCASLHFASLGHTYREVCGFIRGYQYYTTDAFGFAASRRLSTTDQNYVDGFSFTYGWGPRKHLFTYAVGYNAGHAHASCPCAPGGGRSPPNFVGSDYYCSTAYSGSTGPQQSLSTGDPLFDGVGVCAGTCCDNMNQPWFKKKVPQQTTDNLEMRLCVDQAFSDEAVAFDQMELYIRVDWTLHL